MAAGPVREHRDTPYLLNNHELGDLRVCDIKDQATVERIARYLDRSCDEVDGLLTRAARNAFVRRTLGNWAPNSDSSLNLVDAARRADELADLLDLDPAVFKAILPGWNGNTLLTTALRKALPMARIGQWTASKVLNAIDMGDLDGPETAETLGLQFATLRRKLRGSSGRSLMRNVCDWPLWASFDPAPCRARRKLYEARFDELLTSNSEANDCEDPDPDLEDDPDDLDTTDQLEDDGGYDEDVYEQPKKAKPAPLRAGYTAAQLIDHLTQSDPTDLRDRVFVLPEDGIPVPHPYDHQTQSLLRIDEGTTATPPVSGILHLPTGAGKTRIGIDLIRRELKRSPDHTFLWVTQRKALLHQTMVRFAGGADGFPADTRIGWHHTNAELLEDPPHVVFMTQRRLSSVLEAAGRRKAHPLFRRLVTERRPVTLIYDECHQLGAVGLQGAWRKFIKRCEQSARPTPRWRAIGLSATPLPTATAQHRLLEQVIFPKRAGFPCASTPWPLHVFHRVENSQLIDSGVLCRVNSFLDDSGIFDVPESLLNSIIGQAGLEQPGPGASRMELVKYTARFNAEVMSNPVVLEHLAGRLAGQMTVLGKTIVFVPTIGAANRLVAELHRFEHLRGKVATVHSNLDELPAAVGGDDDGLQGREASVTAVLNRFRNLGSEPSILVNVDMLTEGFDDPKIQTVVLARLTLSTNRFWQMIGRGMRGPSSGGTRDCNVIDPIKLMRLYGYFDGYQPNMHKSGYTAAADDATHADSALNPQVETTSRPPEPTEVDEETKRVLRDAGEALLAFIRGGPLSEEAALEIAIKTRMTATTDGIKALPAGNITDEPIPETAAMLVHARISRLEAAHAVTLAWLGRKLPADLGKTANLVNALRKVHAVEQLRLFTEGAYDDADVNGELAPLLATPSPPAASGATEPRRVESPFAANELAQVLLDTCVTLACADHRVVEAEVQQTAEIMRRTFGMAVTEALCNEIRDAATLGATLERLPVLADGLVPIAHPGVIMGLVELASIDNVVTRNEIAVLRDIAGHFDSGAVTLSQSLEIQRVRLGADCYDVLDPEPDPAEPKVPRCVECTTELAVSAKFCMECGARVELT